LTVDLAGLPDGRRTLRPVAADLAGNRSATAPGVTLRLDRRPPGIPRNVRLARTGSGTRATFAQATGDAGSPIAGIVVSASAVMSVTNLASRREVIPRTKVSYTALGSPHRELRFPCDADLDGTSRYLLRSTNQKGFAADPRGTPAVEEVYDSGRECGTIQRESVVLLALACPTAIGVGGILRGRPTLRVKLADGMHTASAWATPTAAGGHRRLRRRRLADDGHERPRGRGTRAPSQL
jgi:hypothetical protein